MEIRQLTYFVAIAETLHFSRAAEAMGLAPSALSMQLQRLERELGVRLVNRTKRSVSLTSAGKLFLEEARIALGQLEHAKRIASRAGRGEAGVIRIGYVISASCCGIVQDILSRFRMLAPQVSISLEELSSPAQLQMLEEGRLDACVVRTLVGGPDQVERLPLRSERIVIAVSSRHPILAKPEIGIGALADELFIAPQFSQDIGFVGHLSRIGEQIGFVPKIGHHTRDFVTTLTLVGAGLGVAAVPESIRSVAIPGVTFLSFDEIEERSELTLMLRRHEMSPVVLKLKQAVTQVLEVNGPAKV
jgi:DNA-binding transcriptional LysR family regulator